MSTINDINNSLLGFTNNTNQVNYENGIRNLGSDQLDKASFLQLMLTQLQNQDPLDPVDNEQMILQQAAFAQVEATEELKDSVLQTNMISQASSMVGKFAQFEVFNEGLQTFEYYTGQVDSITIGDGSVALQVDGQNFTQDQVVQIYNENPNP